MNEDIQYSFDILKKVFGNHSNAAKNLGLTPCHYRAIRNGRVHIPVRTRDLILLKAREVAQGISAPTTDKVEA